jgi:hypothetical protein
MLCELAIKFASKHKKRMLSLVFNKKAQQEAEQHADIPKTVQCMTLHACALRHCRGLECVGGMDDERKLDKQIREALFGSGSSVETSDRLSWPAGARAKAVHREKELVTFWVKKILLLFLGLWDGVKV